ncbi:hypothetical protein VIGAN_04051000 [Vigna angularis var. angularis]|uniref:Uncharacterized protein n=1 Tax=Vigna angularis var. angularis TaxID=157739 RepID=A0A0S3RS42_PHAAN|nr:hypothetical protein VIGAN_04051000 [Vigna angularis var. angularis]
MGSWDFCFLRVESVLIYAVCFPRANMEVGVSRVTNAHHNARGDATRPNTTSPACFSVRSAAGSACVFLRVIMVIRLCALATTTGRPRREDPSALELQPQHQMLLSYIFITSFIVPFKALAYSPTIHMS